MKLIYYVLLMLAGVTAFSAFQKKTIKTQEELMNEYIEDQLSEVRKKEWKKCVANTIIDAEGFVDSIIYQQVNFNIGDSLKAPGKPIKPTKPYDTLKLDSTPIIPILGGK